MAERPSTSKARGVCRFYRTRRGCIHGDHCKFLHGEGEVLTPYDKSKTCRFYASGFCKHGDKCWFKHVTHTTDEGNEGSFRSEQISGSEQPEEGCDKDGDTKCIVCYEIPTTFGLLEGCSHSFCLACIRVWRTSDSDLLKNSKSCPYCRVPSRFVTPSSVFYTNEDPRKAETIRNYKASMARTPCKYFQQSISGSRKCPFGKKCFYEHKEPDGSRPIYERSNLLQELAARTVDFWFYDVESGSSETRLHSPGSSIASSTPEQSFIGRLLGTILTNLEDVLTGHSDSVTSDEHVVDSPSGVASTFEPLEPITSPVRTALPLTREFVDHSMLLESPAFDDYEEDRPILHMSRYRSNGQSAPELHDIVFDSQASENETGYNDVIGVENSSWRYLPSIYMDSTSVSNSLDTGITASDLIRSDIQDQEIALLDNNSSEGTTSSSLSTASGISEVERKYENGIAQLRPKIHTAHEGRNSTQNFVTDGRGRVVATDDYQYSEATALTFEEPVEMNSASAPPIGGSINASIEENS